MFEGDFFSSSQIRSVSKGDAKSSIQRHNKSSPASTASIRSPGTTIPFFKICLSSLSAIQTFPFCHSERSEESLFRIPILICAGLWFFLLSFLAADYTDFSSQFAVRSKIINNQSFQAYYHFLIFLYSVILLKLNSKGRLQVRIIGIT